MKERMTEEQLTEMKKILGDAADSMSSGVNALSKDCAERILAKKDLLIAKIIATMLEISVGKVELSIPAAFATVVGDFVKNEDYIIQILVELKLVSEEQVANARQAVDGLQYPDAIEALVTSKLVTKKQISSALAGQFGMDFIELAGKEIPATLIAMVPRHVAKRYKIVPVEKDDKGTITVALCNPMDVDTLDSLRYILKCNVEGVVATDDDIEAALKKYYPGEDPAVCIPTLFVVKDGQTIDLANTEISPQIISLVSATHARMYEVIPVGFEGDILIIATSDPRDGNKFEELRFVLNREIIFKIATPEQIAAAIKNYYPPEEFHNVEGITTAP